MRPAFLQGRSGASVMGAHWCHWHPERNTQPMRSSRPACNLSSYICEERNHRFCHLLSIFSPILVEFSALRGLPGASAPQAAAHMGSFCPPFPAGSRSVMPNKGQGHLSARLPRTGMRHANAYREQVRRVQVKQVCLLKHTSMFFASTKKCTSSFFSFNTSHLQSLFCLLLKEKNLG